MQRGPRHVRRQPPTSRSLRQPAAGPHRELPEQGRHQPAAGVSRRRLAPTRRTFRRRRALLAGSLAALGIVIGLLATSGPGPKAATGAGRPPGRREGSAAGAAAAAKAAGPPAAEAGVLAWQLPAAISRETLFASTGGRLLLAGGVVGSTSQSAVFDLDPLSGALHQVGNVAAATHDAAGVAVGGRYLLAGGGVGAPTRTVLGFGAGSTTGASLPAPRADAVGVTIGGTGYVVGGYDGAALDAAVLATTDGRTFRTVAELPVPVRYPAVAAAGADIFAFGGATLSGVPVRAVQEVDTTTGRARVVAELPAPLAGASAADLGGTLYIAGGTGAGGASAAVYAFVPGGRRVLLAGSLPAPVAYAGSAVSGGRMYLVGGEGTGGAQLTTAEMVEPNRRFGTAGEPGAGSPFFGDELLVADRGNDRLLLISDAGRVLWTYPSKVRPAPSGGFYFPDDAFFADDGREIVSNEEENDTVVVLAYPSGKVLWSYGHPKVAAAGAGYLHTPDDAYLLRDGELVVADPGNCRVLFVDMTTKEVVHQLGTSGVCTHDPPRSMTSPNGDTPLADGDVLVSEITGSYIDEYTPGGHLVWSTRLPEVGYVSDPQQLGPDRYLVADYSLPGAFVQFDRAGRVLYRYAPASGPDELDHPSLVELLPSGVLMANDDSNDRIVAVDPTTGAKVWQYGETGHPGAGPGLLDTPDGFDLLGPGGTTPTHPTTR